jgi:quinol monooxygenase YgiN
MFLQRMNATHGFHATMRARSGKADELLDLLVREAPTANESCVLFLVGRSASDPDVVHVTEGWTTRAAHAANFATEQSKALVAKIGLLVSEGAEYQDEVPVGGACRA